MNGPDTSRRTSPTHPAPTADGGAPPADAAVVAPRRRAAAARWADRLAERVLLTGALPPAARPLLRPLPHHVPEAPCALRDTHPGSALYVLAHPRSAVAQELHIQQQGCRGGWLEPVAGRKGRRLRWPHLAVARDAVQRLLTLAPRHERGRELQRYLDATPRRQTATLGRLRFRLLGVERQALKKSERQALTVSLAIENQGDQESPKLSPGAYALHGTGPRPLVASFCQPESPGRLAPGARVEIKLTYAAPAGLRGYAMVLAVPRPRAGALYLQVASDVLP